MNKRIGFFNGHFMEVEKISLGINDLAIQRGYGIFDFFRVVNNVPLFMDDYLDRFFLSASAMRLSVPVSKSELQTVIYELIIRNQPGLSGMRIILTGGYSADFCQPGTPNLIIIQEPLQPRPADIFNNGIRIITHNYIREFPEVKSTHYLMGIWLQEKVKAARASDVLYYNNNEVSECPRSNFFIVTQDNVVVTPSNNILRGITRMKTLALARKHFKAEERPVSLEDIRTAKEAFMTSTTKQVIPVVQVDDIILNNAKPGAITTALDGLLQELCKTAGSKVIV